MRHLIAVTLCLIAMTPASAFAQRALSCDSDVAKKQVANLMAMHLGKKQPFAASVAEKATWPYLLKTFEINRRAVTRGGHQDHKSTGANNAWLIVTDGNQLGQLILSNTGSSKALFQICGYSLDGGVKAVPTVKEIKAVRGKKTGLVSVSRTLSKDDTVAEVSLMSTGAGRRYDMAQVDVVLIYFSPSDYAISNNTSITYAGGGEAAPE